MIGRRSRSPRFRRRGFTLVEVLLTLCLIVVITSLAWPVLDKPFANLRLKKVADEVRAQWAGARVEAMDSGRTYVFRYVAGGDRFRIEAYATVETQEDPVYDDYFDGSAGGLGYTGQACQPVDGTLPEGITFETELDSRAASTNLEAGSLTAFEANWSGPILFYPDGTSSTAVLRLKNQHDRCIDVSLRGLTGTSNVGEVFTGQEQSP